jgi:hypothetical protein
MPVPAAGTELDRQDKNFPPWPAVESALSLVRPSKSVYNPFRAASATKILPGKKFFFGD